MPTLIRLFVILLVLAALVLGAMVALVFTVKPTEKQVTIRIPARELVPSPDRAPVVQREIDTTRTPDSPAPATDTPATPAAEPAPAAGGDDVVTLAPGAPE